MGGRGASSGNSINNSYSSPYGFSNVGERQTITLMGGITSRGTVTASKADIEQYLQIIPAGAGSRYQSDLTKNVSRDMRGRGFDISVSENGKLIQTGTANYTFSYSKTKYNWSVKESRSSGMRAQSTNAATAALAGFKNKV